MILSSDELEVLEYLKSYKGNFVSMVEICRSAGGRKKFKESPHWAKRLMSRLVDEKLVEVNERGHYCTKDTATVAPADAAPVVEDYFTPADAPQIVGDDYFSKLEKLEEPEKSENPQIVGDDYFSPLEKMPPIKQSKKQWVSPQIESILKKAGKKPGKKAAA